MAQWSVDKWEGTVTAALMGIQRIGSWVDRLDGKTVVRNVVWKARPMDGLWVLRIVGRKEKD
jgi:hypothetical protein